MPESIEIITQGGSRHRRRLSLDHFRIGRAPDHDLSLVDEHLSWHHAVTRAAGGRVWGGDLSSTSSAFTDGKRSHPEGWLEPGAVLSVDTLTPAEARARSIEPLPYRLSITRDGIRGGEVLRLKRKTGARHRVDSETRVVLLYQLVKQSLEDRSRQRPKDCGWCKNEALIVGVAGRGRGCSSNLLVLLRRIRRELERAGSSPDALEKQRNIQRLRRVELR